MGKGQPFSVRLDEETEKLVEDEARRTRRSKSAVVEAFVEETARTRRFPGIGFRGDDARRRAWVIGSGLGVWEIADMLADCGSVEALVFETQLTAAQVRLAMAYRDHRRCQPAARGASRPGGVAGADPRPVTPKAPSRASPRSGGRPSLALCGCGPFPGRAVARRYTRPR